MLGVRRRGFEVTKTPAGASINAAGRAVTVSGTGGGGGGGDMVSPASSLTYENRVAISMNFTTDAQAIAAGVSSFDTSDNGTYAWVPDPVSGSVNVWRTRYVQTESTVLANILFSPSAKYVYFQWSEYWHPNFASNMNGKCNRLIARIGATLYLDHILFGAPGDDYYGGVLQGPDDVPDPEHTGRNPPLNRGAWYDIAVEHKLSTGADGYWKIWQRLSGGTWSLLPLDYRPYPHTSGFVSNQPYFIGRMHTDPTHLYNAAVVGGWRSGAVAGTENYRYIKDVLILYNASNAPT